MGKTRMTMSSVESDLVNLLVTSGPIYSTANVGRALWRDRTMQPQGAAVAAGKVIHGLIAMGFVNGTPENGLTLYAATEQGRAALEKYWADKNDRRQLSMFD